MKCFCACRGWSSNSRGGWTMSSEGEVGKRFLEAQIKLRKTIKLTEGMAAWKADLANRLWRNEIVFRGLGVNLDDIAELEREVELFNQIVAKLERKDDQ